MRRNLPIDLLNKILQYEDISLPNFDEIRQSFIEDRAIAKFLPDGNYEIDPRNGDCIVFNSTRARRPHDNRPQNHHIDPGPQKDCLICQGKTTQVLDVAPLSEGFTFINKNLFPIFFPFEKGVNVTQESRMVGDGGDLSSVYGFHFLQWSSSFHDKDWHNMPLDDRVVVFNRLAALEKKMMESQNLYVSIIKNYGHLVGGSLAHGHQQIGVSNIMPNRISDDKHFQEKSGESFSAYMLRENPPSMVIKDYGPAVLLTPYFMRRPYDMFLLIKDMRKSYLHDLNQDEVAAAADGWRDAIRIILDMMPRIGKEIAYNVTTHNGSGGGLYFEFLPYTQEMGGFEHLGLYLCQGNPLDSAKTAREALENYA